MKNWFTGFHVEFSYTGAQIWVEHAWTAASFYFERVRFSCIKFLGTPELQLFIVGEGEKMRRRRAGPIAIMSREKALQKHNHLGKG